MKNPKEMTDEKIFFWLIKTTESAVKASYNGGSQSRKYDLVDRFEELKEEACNRGIWEDYCEKVDADPLHDGWDLMA